VGLGLSLELARIHARAHAGYASFCTISETVNCDKVATSRYSVVLGLPVAVWGAVAYGVVIALAASALLRRRSGGTWPVGLLFLLGAAATAASAVLAGVSEFLIGAWCLLCIGSWLVSLALLLTGWWASRAPGLVAAVREDVAAVLARPARAAALGVVLVGGLALAANAYPRYWEAKRSSGGEQPTAGAGARPTAGSGATGTARPAATGPTAVVVYSDYECPYCAKAHEEARVILARRPDVQLVHRQFPLDATCNPAVKRTVHPGACDLARAAICADAQGKLPEMDDALFRNQEEQRPVLDLARKVGLDLDRFRTCLAAPETERRLAADVEAGMRDGVRATPTYVVNGTARAGAFPVDLLPPAPEVPAASR
jgi:protein-disulfide isomerase